MCGDGRDDNMNGNSVSVQNNNRWAFLCSHLGNKGKLKGMFSLPRKPNPNQKGRWGGGVETEPYLTEINQGRGETHCYFCPKGNSSIKQAAWNTYAPCHLPITPPVTHRNAWLFRTRHHDQDSLALFRQRAANLIYFLSLIFRLSVKLQVTKSTWSVQIVVTFTWISTLAYCLSSVAQALFRKSLLIKEYRIQVHWICPSSLIQHILFK